MKKKLLLPIYISISSFSFAQVGINKAQPDLNADLELGSPNKALLLNRVANTTVINSPKNGMLIYDISEQCVKAYQGDAWSQCFWKETPFALTCGAAVFSPSPAVQGKPYAGTLTIPYTGGDGTSYAAQTITSNGLTAVLPAGVFASGNGTLQYTIAGSPTSVVPTIFNVSIKGSTCSSLSLPVNGSTPVIPSNITLQNGIYFVASVYDNNYSPFKDPTGPATTDRPVDVGPPNTDKLVDYQGIIPTTGLDVFIPATVTGVGTSTLPAWSGITTVKDYVTEDGTVGQLMLSWSQQSGLTSNTIAIKAKLTAIGKPIYARKLDINAGIGSDYLGVLMASFQFPSNSSGASGNYDVRILPGIPDRNFSVDGKHNFLYLPVQAEDGNTWLNNNLGADYSNTNNPNFNLAQQGTSGKDFRAYGSLFQWGRKADGHELINWTSPTTGNPVNPTGGVRSDNPADPKFIEQSDWRLNTSANTLWDNIPTSNNPCPKGFKVPTREQMENFLKDASAGSQISNAAKSKLVFTGAGNRSIDNGANLNYTGVKGFYWTASAGGPSAYYIKIDDIGTPTPTVASSAVGYGQTVRCIKQ